MVGPTQRLVRAVELLGIPSLGVLGKTVEWVLSNTEK
ncbi:uncharacterized protein METZ01_LOCUS31852 [marine metagenome]|uniref:Uncharacterized protein n=1 Tax=marine metagenome TaxID=408172 RepID=A0A381QJ83_9ZZZZ